MKFYTSYYANIKNIPEDYIKVSISGDIPDYINARMDIWDKRLAPNWDLFREYKGSEEGQLRENRYVKRFKEEILLKNNINDIFKSWSDVHGLNEKYVIMCYEVPADFCHRHIVSEAISDKYGVDIQEIGIDYNTHELIDYKYKIKGNFDETEW